MLPERSHRAAARDDARERVELEVVRWIENQLEHWTGERNNGYLAEYVASIDTLGEVKGFIAESFGDETGSRIFTQVCGRNLTPFITCTRALNNKRWLYNA